MKKFLCVALILLSVIAAASGVPVSAQDSVNPNVLVITANGENPVEVEVGNEFIYFVGIDVGDSKIVNGQVSMHYDSEHISFVPHGAGADNEQEAYSFPRSIYNTGVVMNADTQDWIYYNFTRVNGIAVFNNTDLMFTRFRFKAVSPGYTDISYVIEYMMNENRDLIYNKCVPNEEIDPVIAVTIEPAVGLIGDVDRDFDVDVLDVTRMQRIAAGVLLAVDTETADLSGDQVVSLKDAVILRKYLAGREAPEQIGTWRFESELTE